jgi:hypothetical protein
MEIAMPTAKKRITLIPDLEALAVCGRDVQSDEVGGRWNNATLTINGLIRRFAVLIQKAGREVAARFSRAEWNLIGDALQGNGSVPQEDVAYDTVTLIRATVQDADHLEGAGKKWKVNVGALVKKLETLSLIEGEAILAAVRWFGEHLDEIKNDRDEWWLPTFRRKAVSTRLE